MKNLFDANSATALQQRLGRLQPDSQRLWGTMTPAQAVAHCAAGMEMATGVTRPGRHPMGRIFGWIIKPLALGNDEPMRRNTPTVEGLVITDQRELGAERERLRGLIDQFVAAGPAGCTTHPHAFFGRLTPDEWAVLMYKHVDHHLRQFGV